MKGKVSVVKIDTDKYPNIASRYGIKVSPCSPELFLLNLTIQLTLALSKSIGTLLNVMSLPSVWIVNAKYVCKALMTGLHAAVLTHAAAVPRRQSCGQNRGAAARGQPGAASALLHWAPGPQIWPSVSQGALQDWRSRDFPMDPRLSQLLHLNSSQSNRYLLAERSAQEASVGMGVASRRKWKFTTRIHHG